MLPVIQTWSRFSFSHGLLFFASVLWVLYCAFVSVFFPVIYIWERVNVNKRPWRDYLFVIAGTGCRF